MKPKVKGERLEIRLSREEKAKITQRARAANMDVSSWIRMRLLHSGSTIQFVNAKGKVEYPPVTGRT